MTNRIVHASGVMMEQSTLVCFWQLKQKCTLVNIGISIQHSKIFKIKIIIDDWLAGLLRFLKHTQLLA